MDFKTSEADGDPADNSVYGWKVDSYGDGTTEMKPLKQPLVCKRVKFFQWLDGVPFLFRN